MLSLLEKINESNNSRGIQNSNLKSRRINIDNNILSNSNIKLNFDKDEDSKSVNSKEEYEEEDSNKNLINEQENLLIFDNDNSIENLEEDKNEEEKEKKLEYLYHKYMNSYKKKKYNNIINDVANKSNIFNKKSPMSFNIFLLKIRCLLKGIKAEYILLIKFKAEKSNFLETSKKIAKVIKEFKSISSVIDINNKSHYEQITQVYCKFLLYLSLIYKLKEEYIKSFEYLIMGMNSLKIFFIKQKTASDLKTYTTYCKILLLIINQLIGDNNYTKALFYCNINFKVLEIIFKFMKFKNIKQKQQLKFLEYIGYNYLFIGLCLEQQEDANYESCFETYRQADYFFKKEEKNNSKNLLMHNMGFSENGNINIFLTEILLDKYKKKFDEEKRKKELLKRQILKIKNNKNKEKEKKDKLDLLSTGFKSNNKYIPMENIIYKNILTSNIQNNIEKLDNELISVIYKENKNNSGTKRPLSNSIKRNLCHLKVYNILMSNQFREYVINNKNFEFNNPIKEKQSIENLQRYLNKKIEINIGTEPPPLISNYSSSLSTKNNLKNNNNYNNNNDKAIFKNKLNKNHRNNHNGKKLILKNVNNKNKYNNKTAYNSFSSYSLKNKDIKYRNNIYLNKNINKNKININQLLFNKTNNSPNNFINKTKKEIEKNNNEKIPKKIQKNLSDTRIINNYTDNKKYKNLFSRQKLGIKSPFLKNTDSLLESDFERKYLDKNLLSQKYFKKFFYLDSLTTKELSFQKKMLDLKDNNSKLFFGDYKLELNNGGKMAREDAYKKYLLLNNKAMAEIKNIQNDDYMDEKNNINILENAKTVLRVLNKTIHNNKEKKIKKIKIYSESYKSINRNNEDKLLDLNNGIKELNFILSYKNKKLQNHKNIKFFE